jgi:hypothetical protein
LPTVQRFGFKQDLESKFQSRWHGLRIKALFGDLMNLQVSQLALPFC